MEIFLQTIVSGILIGAMYGLVALGLALLMGVMKFLNVAHGTFIVMGGYVAYWAFTLFGINPYLAIPLVIIAMFIVGLVFYRLALSPLLKLPNLGTRISNSMLITFGVIYILDNTMAAFWKPDTRSVVTSYSVQSIPLGPVKLSITGLAGLGVAIVVAIGLHLLLSKTQFGKHVRAATQDSEAAGLCGINVQRTYLISSGIAIALAGIAGVVVVSSLSISPSSGLSWLLIAFVVMVLAGEGNLNAVIPAGIVLGLLEAIGVTLVGQAYRQAVALIIFILYLMWKSRGQSMEGDKRLDNA